MVTGNRGESYRLGLFHGDNTGHVLVHCNTRIMLIDFSVRQSKTYSFFLGDELCELSIEADADGYRYQCALNREAATPLNKIRQASEEKHWRKAMLLGGSFFGLVFVLSLLMSLTMKPTNQTLLEELEARGGARTSVRLVPRENGTGWQYSYRAGEQVYSGQLASSSMESELGLPLQSGDEFELRYVPGQPGIYYIDFERPTPAQVDRFLERIVQHHAALHPEMAPRQAYCQVLTAIL